MHYFISSMASNYIATEIVRKLRDNNPPLRPQLPENCQSEITSLMKSCWKEDPEIRPSFDNVKSRLGAAFKYAISRLSIAISFSDIYQAL